MRLVHRETCGRCGVYRRLHPTKSCDRARLAWWWREHFLRLHVGNWLWLKAPSRFRWWVAEQLKVRGRCWCGLFDSVWYADKWDDEPATGGPGTGSRGYRHDYEGKWGCLCDFPAVWAVGAPDGNCYCQPPAEATP